MRGKRIVRRSLGTLVCGASLAGAALVATAPPGAAAGSRVTDAPDGFSLILPGRWHEVALSGSDIGALLGNAAKDDKAIDQAAVQQALNEEKKGLKFFAFSSTPEDNGNFFPNMNVGIYQGSAPASLLDAQAKIELTQIGAHAIRVTQVSYPSGRAVEATYTIALNPTTTLYGTQVYTEHAGSVYIATFTAGEKAVEARAAATVMPSWRFTKK